VTHGLIPVLSTAWRRRISWYPGDWIWPVLGALLIAAAAAAIAIAATNDNGSATKTRAGTNDTVPAGTGPVANPPPPSDTGTGPEPTASVPTTAPTQPPQPPPPPATITTWPAGQNGWTIVLASVPQSAGRGAAAREAQKALGAGLSDVGVMNSSQFSSLHSGYFVVFSGIYSSEREARSNLGSAKGTFPQAYARQIVQ
jgi:hypothetical protein